MPVDALDVHPEALLEAEAELSFYASRSPAVADRLLAELEKAIDLIQEGPDRWPPYIHGTRRYVLRKFPYSVVYRRAPGLITVYAFAHAKRRPGYWQKRLH